MLSAFRLAARPVNLLKPFNQENWAKLGQQLPKLRKFDFLGEYWKERFCNYLILMQKNNFKKASNLE